MLFIGVSTPGSGIFELFPRWTAILGLNARIVGHDVPLGAPAGAFRSVVSDVAADPDVRGALVTGHKVELFRHAADLFDELDEYARLCREVSCISKRDGALVGHAKDPITAGRTLGEFLPRDWPAGGAHALCFGAGGAGTAITLHLLCREQPARVVVTDRDLGRLAAVGAAADELGRASDVRLEHVGSAEESDALLAALPPGSLVVNATGLGKDAPGSPISDAAVFPDSAVVWELNYRGDLRFLEQARRRQQAQAINVHDGWRYFLHGWAEIVAEVFDLELTPQLFAELAEAAELVRSPGGLGPPAPAPRPPG
jgi:shikimate dehydrogenase